MMASCAMTSRVRSAKSHFTPTCFRSAFSVLKPTDSRRANWPRCLPPKGSTEQASATRVLLAVISDGLARLDALPDAVFHSRAARLAASLPADRAGPSACPLGRPSLRARPTRALTSLLRLLVWESIGADTDHSVTLTTQHFGCFAKKVLAKAVTPTAGVAAHGFRRGGASARSHGGLSLSTLFTALCHASDRSTTPSVFQAVPSAATAIGAAVRRRGSRGRGRAGLDPGHPSRVGGK